MSKPYMRFVAVVPEDIAEFAEDEDALEMHDRIIVGLARRLEAPLLTQDSEIADAGIVRTEW